MSKSEQMGRYTRTHETATQETLPAVAEEHQQFAYDLTKLKEFTIRPGLLRLPVHDIRPAANSPKVVLELDHPFIPPDDLRYFIKKPAYWDPSTFQWCKILEWYGYRPTNQHQLRTDRIYVRHNTRTDEWELTQPPSPYRTSARRWRGAISNQMPTSFRLIGSLWRWLFRATCGKVRRTTPRSRTSIVTGSGLLAFTGTLLGWIGLVAGVTGMTLAVAAVISTAVALATMLIAAVVVEPPEGYQ